MRIPPPAFDTRFANWPPPRLLMERCLFPDCPMIVAGWHGMQQCFCVEHVRPFERRRSGPLMTLEEINEARREIAEARALLAEMRGNESDR